MAKRKTTFNPRITKKINNLSRAINKIDKDLQSSTLGMTTIVRDIQAGINDITYTKNGVEQKVRYDAIERLSRAEQSALLKELSLDRYNLRTERALQQLKEKGKISWQFKKSLGDISVDEKTGKVTYTGDNPRLLQSIKDFEEKYAGNKPDVIKEEFEKIDIQTGDQWFDEADTHFNQNGTPSLFDFYRPGEAGGFVELNAFTWNTYKIERGME